MQPDLGRRRGHDAQFLELPGGRGLPMPQLRAAGRKVAAPRLDGQGHQLDYGHFSLLVHPERRLPLLTISDIDWRSRSRPRNPATGKPYTRVELAGDPNQAHPERWRIDPRLAPAHQLPDVFYNQDGKAFDKGHVVRRDDVCWGADFHEAQCGNGDSFHVTNCTPQVAGFNQSAQGQQNWGDFENEIQRVTGSQKAVVLAGPVLNPDDRRFHGRDAQGPIKLQVPRGFWKIVVARGARGPQAWGFLLGQDLSEVPLELDFGALWSPMRRRIRDIEALLQGWVDLSALIEIDQPLPA